MKIIVLNGSPKGEKSNTYKLTTMFLEGLDSARGNFVETVGIAEADIRQCLGCYACWNKTPGRCVIKDGMAGLIQKYVEADLVVWSFPLYYLGMPSGIKGFLDRLLPTLLPTIRLQDGARGHPPRYDLSHQRHVLISTCGLYATEGNYDALFRQFETLFGDKLTKIICPEGELFRVPELSERTDRYLFHVKTAGKEYSDFGSFSKETAGHLNELLYPPKAFVQMANASWGIGADIAPDRAEQPDKSHLFIRRMAAVYNPRSYAKNIILEMHFTDLDKTYQLLLGKESCEVKTDGFLPYTTKIETSFATWEKISKGEINGSEAMMKRKYRVLGDFSTLLHMDEFFGVKKPSTKSAQDDKRKDSNMKLFLLPFLALWIVMPIHAVYGGVAAVLAGALVGLLHIRWKPTPYERLGNAVCALIGVIAILRPEEKWLLALPSFAFGALWLASCCTKIPLCAYYSSSGYGGEKAYENPLFLRTNRILALVWGAASLAIAAFSFLVTETAAAPFWGAISSVPTIGLGIFTAWFIKTYPARVAAREIIAAENIAEKL